MSSGYGDRLKLVVYGDMSVVTTGRSDMTAEIFGEFKHTLSVGLGWYIRREIFSKTKVTKQKGNITTRVKCFEAQLQSPWKAVV